MWRERYNLSDDPDKEPEKSEEPVNSADGLAIFEVAVFMQVELLADAKAGEQIPVRLRVRADAYNIGSFTEVLQNNNLPYAVAPATPEEDHDE